MMNEYSILLPNEKAKTYSLITLLILIINLLVFGYIFFNAADGKMRILSLSGAIISCVYLVLYFLSFFFDLLKAFNPRISFIILSMFWFVLGNFLLAFCILSFAVIGFFMTGKFKVVFSADKILYPSFPVKTFLWSDVSNVMLKDKVLTIDLKNNKLIQVVVEKGSAEEIDEDGFNKFCREQMNLSAMTQSR